MALWPNAVAVQVECRAGVSFCSVVQFDLNSGCLVEWIDQRNVRVLGVCKTMRITGTGSVLLAEPYGRPGVGWACESNWTGGTLARLEEDEIIFAFPGYGNADTVRAAVQVGEIDVNTEGRVNCVPVDVAAAWRPWGWSWSRDRGSGGAAKNVGKTHAQCDCVVVVVIDESGRASACGFTPVTD